MFTRALILGASGMIGAHAVRACLRHGTPVRAFVRARSDRRNLDGLDIETATGDLGDRGALEQAVEGCDLVIHAAGAYPKKLFGKRAFLDAARREMENVLAAARAGSAGSAPAAPKRRLVYVSSVTTIGRAAPDDARAAGGQTAERAVPRPARETDRAPLTDDDSPYFAVKLLMEDMATEAAAAGLDLVIVNPTFCVDALDTRRTTAQLLLPLARRQIPACVPGQLNAVAARDVGEGILLAARRGRAGERYILGGENMTSPEFLARCATVAGVPAPRLVLPIAIAEAVSWLTEVIAHLTGTRPLFPMAGVRMMKHSQPYDITRAREELGFEPTSIDDAIERAYAWYRAEGMLKRQ